MGNLTDLGSGSFNMHGTADGSLTGNLNGGTAGTLSYANYTTAVTLDLDGTTYTGIAGTTSNISTVVGSGNADTVTGTAQTYTVTGSNAGNNGTITWSSFENIDDKTTGTLRATSATWTLNGSNTGTVTNLGGTFADIGNLTDLGSGSFNMHGTADGSITGNLNGGSAGTLSYANYTTAVTLNLDGTGYAGIAGRCRTSRRWRAAATPTRWRARRRPTT